MVRIARFVKRVPARDGESTQSRGIPRESGLSGSATRFSPYSVHSGGRGSRRRDGDDHGLAPSFSQQVTESATDRVLRREISEEERAAATLFPRADALVGSPKEQGR